MLDARECSHSQLKPDVRPQCCDECVFSRAAWRGNILNICRQVEPWGNRVAIVCLNTLFISEARTWWQIRDGLSKCVREIVVEVSQSKTVKWTTVKKVSTAYAYDDGALNIVWITI